jgi:hypothetical protein
LDAEEGLGDARDDGAGKNTLARGSVDILIAQLQLGAKYLEIPIASPQPICFILRQSFFHTFM